MEEFPQHFVEAVDKLVEKAAKLGALSYVAGDKEFGIAVDLWNFWKHFFPHEYKDFVENQKQNRRDHLNKHASARDKGGGLVRHMAEFPGRWHKMMYEFFPDQYWDKKFVRKLIKYIPELQVPRVI